jgi:glucose/mannose transport system substrate-binding protein
VDLRTKLAGSASRRNILKGGAAVGAGTFGLNRFGGSAFAQATPGAATGEAALEVFSWWTSPGEAPALQALFDAYNGLYSDVEIVNAAVAGGAGVNARAVLITRLQGGQPPDSWQTHVGRELIDNYVVPGYCEPVTDIYESEGLLEVIPPTLIDQASQDTEQYSVPVGVHRGNGFWYNRQVLEENGVTVGETMTIEDFLAAAETLQGAGITPLRWRPRTPSPPPRPSRTPCSALPAGEVRPALQGGGRLGRRRRPHRRRDLRPDAGIRQRRPPGADLGPATAMVLEGRAAFNSMGDWAYGEVVARDAAENTGWVSHPGTQGSFVLVVDSFTLPVGAPAPGERQELAARPRVAGSPGRRSTRSRARSGPDRHQPGDLLALPPVVDRLVRQRRPGALLRPRPGIVARLPAGVL